MNRSGYSFNTISLKSADPLELSAFLEQRIAPCSELYDNTPVVLDISELAYPEFIDYTAFKKICEKFNLYLIGVCGITTEQRAEPLIKKGIPIVNTTKFARIREENFKPRVVTQSFEVKVPVKVPVPYEVKVPYEVRIPEPMMIVARNVRSGERISSRGNSVAIFGSVANGAEVIASHNIIIFGDLNGSVYAGSPDSNDKPGYPQGFIYTQGQFNPTLVAIAGNYQTADDMLRDPLSGPVRKYSKCLLVTLDGNTLNYQKAEDFNKLYTKF